MLLDEKGKLFGKISIIDLFIILAVLVCLTGVYVRFVARPPKAQVEPTKFTYQVVVRNLRETSVDTLKQSISSEFSLGEKGRSDDLGVLKEVTAQPSKETMIQSSGKVITVDSPSKWDAILTLELEGMSNERGYFTPQLKDIGVGGTLLIQNKYIKTEGQVISLTENK